MIVDFCKAGKLIITKTNLYFSRLKILIEHRESIP